MNCWGGALDRWDSLCWFYKRKIYSLVPHSDIKKIYCAACDFKAPAFVWEENTSQHHRRFLKVLIDYNLASIPPSFIVVGMYWDSAADRQS